MAERRICVGTYARRVGHTEAGDGTAVETIQHEQDGPLERLVLRKGVVPPLAVPVDAPRAAAEDVDVPAADPPEGRADLVADFERVVHPAAHRSRDRHLLRYPAPLIVHRS